MSTLSDNILSLDVITLSSSTTARNLRVIFHQNLSFIPNIKQVSRMRSFTCIKLPRSEASCLRVMLKNWSKPFLLLDWTTATHYYQDVQIM